MHPYSTGQWQQRGSFDELAHIRCVGHSDRLEPHREEIHDREIANSDKRDRDDYDGPIGEKFRKIFSIAQEDTCDLPKNILE